MVIRHTEPAVRPEDVLAALRQIVGLAPASPPAVTRVAQGVLGDDGVVGPGSRLRWRDTPVRQHGCRRLRLPQTQGSQLRDPKQHVRRRTIRRRTTRRWGAAPPDAAIRGAGTDGRAMRAPVRPMGRGPVLQATLVRLSARRPGRSAAARHAGQSSRPRAELRQVTNLGAVAAVVASSRDVETICSRAARGPLTGSRARELDGRLPGCSKTSRTTENSMMGQVDQTVAR